MIHIPRPTTAGLWPAVALFSAVSTILPILYGGLRNGPGPVFYTATAAAIVTLLIWPLRGTQPRLAATVIGLYLHPLLALAFFHPLTDSLWHWTIDLLHPSLDIGLHGGFLIPLCNRYASRRLLRRQ